jgi:transcriptional regulator with XRE-family HTH domain
VPLTREAPVVTELQLGTRIRALRQARRLTLRDVAERAGVTESFLSQVERDVTSPSIATVHRIARALGLSIAQLFAEDGHTGRVVRREARRRVSYPGLRSVDEFLTSNMAGRLQVIMSTIEPGGGTGEEPYTHDSDEEVVVVLAGVLDLWVADEHYVLREGDAITFPSRLPHWNANHGEESVQVIFCLTPPSF